MTVRALQDCRDIILRKARWLSSRRDAAEKVRCLETLMEFGDFEELPLIFRCLRDDSAVIRDKASDAVRFFWQKGERINTEESPFRSLAIEQGDLDYFRIDFGQETYLALIRIASINHNGFVRERAVTELGRLKSQENLKFVLLRLGDWVSQVRLASLTAMRAYLDPKNVKSLIGEFLLIDRLQEVQRTDLADVQKEIVEFILENASPEDVGAFNEAVRLRYFRHFFKRSDIDEPIASKIFEDSNFLIRLLVLDRVSRFNNSFQKGIIRLALKDRATLIKMKALDKARQFSPDLSDEIRTLLLDKANSVRDLARTLLKPTGMDFIDFYRKQVESGESVSGGVMGLCDIGGNENLGIYKKYAFSTQARVSMGCLLALNKFDGQLAIQYALEMLGHKSGNVRRVAIGILAKQATKETLDWVRKRYVQADLRIKIASMAVFKRVGGWSVLPDFIDSLSDENAEVRKSGWQLLVKWRTDAARLFVQPNIQDLARARQSLEKIGPTYKIEMSNWQEELLKQIAFFVR
jgi:HEAT repeat protein